MSAGTSAPQLYLVPCMCGKKVRVRARQAGEQVTCECGAMVSVPTIRRLKELEAVIDEAERPTPQRSSLQGPIFSIGVLAVFAGALLLLGVWMFPPANLGVDWQGMAMSAQDAERADKPVEDLGVLELYDEFLLYRDRARQTPWDHVRGLAEAAEAQYRSLLTTGGVLVALGALATIIGLMMPVGKR